MPQLGGIKRTLDVILFNHFYPLILILASWGRVDNIISIVYLLNFLVLGLWAHVKRRRDSYKICTFICFLTSVLGIASSIVFNILLHFRKEIDTSSGWIHFFGLVELEWEILPIRWFISDLIVLITSLIILIRLKLYDPGYKILRRNSGFLYYDSVILICLGLAGASLPTLLNIVYYLVFLTCSLAIQKWKLEDIMNWIWKLIFIFCLVHGSILYLCQFQFIYQNLSIDIINLLGILHYSDLSLAMWPYFVSYLSILALFWMFILKLKKENKLMNQTNEYEPLLKAKSPNTFEKDPATILSKNTSSPLIKSTYTPHFKDPPSSTFQNRPDHSFASTRRFSHEFKLNPVRKTAMLFYKNHGWKFCLAILLIDSFLNISIYSFVTLIIISIGLLYQLNFFVPFLVCYLPLGSLTQYIWNLPFDYPQSPLLTDFGFVQLDIPFINIGVRCLAVYLVSLYATLKNFKPPEENILILAKRSGRRRSSVYSKAELFVQTSFFLILKDLSIIFLLVCLKLSSIVSLVGLYFCGLTRVDILNAGYMLFFITFISSFRLRKKLWISLVFYSEFVVLSLYFWQFHWFRVYDIELLGLRKLPSPEWIGMGWNIVIMLFSILQFHLNQIERTKKKIIRPLNTVEEEQEDRINDPIPSEERSLLPNRSTPDSIQLSKLRMPESLGTFINFGKTFYSHYFLFFCYIVFVLVAILDKLTISSILYFLFLFVCLIMHMLFIKGERIIRVIWPILVLFCGIILISKYIYQFPEVSNLLASQFPANKYISLEDIGLETYEVSDLFKELFSNTLILIVSVFQWSIFIEAVPEFDPSLKKSLRIIYEFIMFCKRFLILHFSKLTALVIWIGSVYQINAINFVYVIALIISLFFRNQTDAFGLLFMIYSQVVIISQLLWNFPFFNDYRNDSLPQWIGFVTNSTHLWSIVGIQCIFIFIIFLQRLISRWDPQPARYVLLFSLSMNVEISEDGDIIVEEEFLKSQVIAYDDNFITKLKWYINNFYALYGYKILTIVILLSLAFRDDLTGIIYLILFAFCIRISREAFFKREFPILLIVSIALIIIQYIELLFPLPFGFSNTPWEYLPIDVQDWFVLHTVGTFQISLDFIILFLSLILWTQPKDQVKDVKSFTKQMQKEREQALESNPDQSNPLKLLFIVRHSADLVLVLTFVVGTVHDDLLSLGYVVISLYFLWNNEPLLEKGNKLWKYPIIYNFFVVLIQIIYQLPFIPHSSDITSWQNIVGLLKISASNTHNRIILDLILLFFLLIQAKFFQDKKMKIVLKYVKEEQDSAIEKSRKYFAFKQENLKIQEENAIAARKLRWTRLEQLKQSRKTKNLTEEEKFQEILNRQKSLIDIDVMNEKLIEGEDIKKLEEGQQEEDNKKEDQVKNRNKEEEQDEKEDNKKEEGQEKIENSDQVKPLSTRKKIIAKINQFLIWLTKIIEKQLVFKNDKNPSKPFMQLLRSLFYLIQEQSRFVCYFTMILNHIINASIISIVYPFVVFGHALLLPDPKPTKRFWKSMLMYTILVIIAKFLFQIPIFCICDGETELSYSFYDVCETLSCQYGTLNPELSFPYVLGIIKINGIFLRGVIWDFIVLLAILWHRQCMQSTGLWDYSSKEDIEGFPISPISNHQSMVTIDNNIDETFFDEQEESEDQIQKEDETEERISMMEDDDGEIKSPEKLGSSWSQFIQRINFFLKRYFGLILQRGEGRDYYAILFLVDLLAFFVILVFQQDFTGIQTNFFEFFTQSRIPSKFLLVLMVQFGLIILERVIYLFRSLLAKLILQYFLLLSIHIILFFYIPQTIQRPFLSSPGLVLFYLIKAIYFYYSGLQIQHSYPIEIKERFLTRKASFFRDIIFSGYRAIPFVFELKTLVDFIVSDTTLTFKEFLKLEDLYNELFLVKCKIVDYQEEARPKGAKQPVRIKCTQGVVLFSILIILIWLPLLLLSSGNPTNEANLISEASLEISIKGYNPFFQRIQVNTGISLISSDQFSILRTQYLSILSEEIRSTQIISFGGNSEALWLPSPPAFESLKEFLLSNTSGPAQLEVRIGFARGENLDAISSALFYKTLSDDEKFQLGSALGDYFNPTNFSIVQLSSIQPRVMRLESTNQLLFLSPSSGNDPGLLSASFQLLYNSHLNNSVVRWWEVVQIPTSFWPSTSTIQVVCVSNPLPSGITASLVSGGLIGLYVGVVLSVGRFLRMWVSSLVQRIYLDEMQNVDKLLMMCEDIFLARQGKELLLEEELYQELMLLFRSPERLLQLTKKNN